MRQLLIGVGLALSLGMRIQPLGAQSPVSVGVGAGIAMPSTTLRDEANPGLRALASLDVGMPDMPTSLRIDAAYDRFGFKSTPVGSAGPPTGARTITSVSLSLSLGSPDSLSKFSPYAVGGLTMSRVGCAGRSDCEAVWQTGWNAGLGLRFILFGRRAFAEGRMHCVLRYVTDICYIPFTVGLLFGAQGAIAEDGTSDGPDDAPRLRRTRSLGETVRHSRVHGNASHDP